jgi:hypothetical protein
MAQVNETVDAAPPGRSILRLSYLLSWLPAALMLVSGSMKLVRSPQVLEQMSSHFGWPGSVLFAVGLAEMGCTVLYLVPRTSVLGAVLLTGYLGGAVATHVRIGEPFFAPIAFGVVFWLGLWLREPRLKELLPWR